MELSEAIRAGARLRPQAYGGLVRWAPDRRRGPVPATCALGAAAEAAGLVRVVEEGGETRIEWVGDRGLRVRFPILSEPAPVPLPCGCHSAGCGVEGAVTHLNDAHRWSRESVASWVAWLERK